MPGEEENYWIDCEEKPVPLSPECYLSGKRAVLTIDSHGAVNVSTTISPLSMHPRPRVGPLLNSNHHISVPLTETAAVEMRGALHSVTKLCGGNDSPSLVLHTFRRRGMDWIPHEAIIEFDDERVALRWSDHIQSHLDTFPERPRRLFVVMNPYGGSRNADSVWKDVAKPIFDRAHILCDAFRTGYRDHAKDLIAEMTWEEFSRYDGIVAVGGDGLFQECLRGVLLHRKKGGRWRDKAADIRIAQIPAGSTDAVACTVNGSRSAHTAALHVVLGDRSSLDVLEVRSIEGEQRFSCSTTSYGFIADLLERSENMRWMGPARYDFCGLMTFMRLKSYPVRIYYRRPRASHGVRGVCGSMCQVCSQPGQHRFDDSAIESHRGATSNATHSRNVSNDCFTGLPLTDFICSHQPSLSGGTADSFPHFQEDWANEGDDATMARTEHTNSNTSAEARVAHSEIYPESAAPFTNSAAYNIPLDRTRTQHGQADGAASSVGDAVATESMHEDWFSRIRVNGESDSEQPTAADDEGWRIWEGEISSLMVVVTSTRSDKSKHGLVPHAHLSDGRLHLVIVRKCTRMQFLRFLLGVSRAGVDETLDFVDIKEVEAWRLEPLDLESQQSVWNVDGELTQTKYMSARCHHGLIDVFGRGPEL